MNSGGDEAVLTRDFLRNLHLGKEENDKRRLAFVEKEVRGALAAIKDLASKRRTKYSVSTLACSTKPEYITDIYNGLRLHLPDSKIVIDTLGNAIIIDWA
jgi:hypothetical protein